MTVKQALIFLKAMQKIEGLSFGGTGSAGGTSMDWARVAKTQALVDLAPKLLGKRGKARGN